MKNAWQNIDVFDWKIMGTYNEKTRTHNSRVSQLLKILDSNGINPSSTTKIIDCGPGFIGSEAWSFSDFINCEIIGLEPQTDRFLRLKEGKYPGKLFNCAVGKNNSKIQGWMGHTAGKSDFRVNIEEKLKSTGNYILSEIDCCTIDSLINPTDENVIVWADIEGAELDMLYGCNKSLENKKISAFFLEIHGENSGNHIPGQKDKIFSIMQNHGFRSYVLGLGEHLNVSDYIFLRSKE